jgi:acetylornithine aminotransferase
MYSIISGPARIRAVARRTYTSAAAYINQHSPYAVTTYSRPNIVLTKARGSLVWDMQGKEYVDFISGIAVTGLGHCDPNITEILRDQGSTLIHSSNLYYNDWTLKLGKDLIETTRNAGAMVDASRVFLANSGTEANEAAIKFARKWGNLLKPNHEKTEIVSFENSFHGRTFGSLSATVNPKYQSPFLPMVPGFRHGKINDLAALGSLVTENTCAVIIEPIQGEGGVNVASTEFLMALRRRCDEIGALLIYDEIQCGLGRTGQLWAHQVFPKEAHPDILTMAKALGNGYPIGATMITERVESIMTVGDHGTTYGGNPLGARIASYVLSKLSSEEILSGVTTRSQMFTKKFDEFHNKFPEVVADTRGRGLLLGLQLKVDPTSIVSQALEKGLLLITCGKNTLRFVPALNIPEELVTRGLDIVEECLAQAANDVK